MGPEALSGAPSGAPSSAPGGASGGASGDAARRRSLGVQLSVLVLAVAALLGGAVAAGRLALASAEDDADRAQALSDGRAELARIQIALDRWLAAPAERRPALEASIREHARAMERRLDDLRDGNPALHLEPPDTDADRRALDALALTFGRDVAPELDRAFRAGPADAPALADAVRARLDDAGEQLERAGADGRRRGREHAARLRWIQGGLGAAAAALAVLALLLARATARRAAALGAAAAEIAAGSIDRPIPASGRDELAALGASIASMRTALASSSAAERGSRDKVERALDSIVEVVARMTAASTELLAAMTQQSATTQEQTTAISEIVATLDEIATTAEQATLRTQVTAEAAKRSEETSTRGKVAVEQAASAMEAIKDQLDRLAEAVLTLAERGQAIGDIVVSINDIAEQSHVLALNASIEAARAGDAGRGFAIVAREVKGLADQSKQATSEIRAILGEIQRSTNSTVMLSEDGTKGAAAATRQVAQAGETIRVLADQITDASRTASQSVASAGQQAMGISQIRQAMRAIHETTQQNLVSTRQTQQAADDVSKLASQLQGVVASYGRR